MCGPAQAVSSPVTGPGRNLLLSISVTCQQREEGGAAATLLCIWIRGRRGGGRGASFRGGIKMLVRLNSGRQPM